MPRRTVLTVMAWSPIILTAFIGLQTRLWQPDWQFPSATPEQEKAIYAYAPIVEKTQAVVSNPKATSDEAMAVAKEWLTAAEKGELQPLTPAFYEDRSDEGPKAEIIGAEEALASNLVNHALKDQSASTEDRVEQTLTALKLSESLKYSDFRTLYLATKDQSRGIQLLHKLAPSMSETLRTKVKAEVAKMSVSQTEFDNLTQKARTLFAQYRLQRGLEPLKIEEAQLAYSLTERMKTHEDPMRVVSGPLYASTGTVPDYVTELGLAWQSCQNHNQRVDKLVSALATQK